MFTIGDRVIFSLDGAIGIVLDTKHHLCQVIWEDCFVSWEKEELLKKDDEY